MGKYDGLTAYLESLDANRVRLTFGQIERIIGARLPPSAHRYNAWWSNDHSPGRQSGAWLSLGWATQDVDLGSQEVTFRRQD